MGNFAWWEEKIVRNCGLPPVNPRFELAIDRTEFCDFSEPPSISRGQKPDTRGDSRDHRGEPAVSLSEFDIDRLFTPATTVVLGIEDNLCSITQFR